jgi:RND family efflux transporter MFP subunit
MWSAKKTQLDTQEAKRVKDDNKDDYEDLEKQSIDTAAVQAEKNFDSAEQKYLEADVAIKAAKAQVNSTWLAYQATQDLIIKSPAAGTVANLSFKVGDHVTAGNTVSGGIPVLTLGDFSIYTVTLELNEVDIPKVKVGQNATFTLDAFPGEKFQGEVIHADTIGTNTNGVITYTVIVKITDPKDSIRPTMTANVDIVVDKAENILAVPNSAIKPYEGGKAVQIIDPETKTAKYIPVEVGIKSPERTQIISGIEEGAEVITGAKNVVVETSGGRPFGNN